MSLTEWSAILGNFGEFLGAMAVVATLAYLSIQVKAARTSATLAAIQTNRAQRIEQFALDRDSPYIPAILARLNDGDELGTEDQFRLRNHLARQFAIMYSEWIQRDMGLAPEYQQNHEFATRLLIANPVYGEWWSAVGKYTYPEGFVDYIEGLLPSSEEE